MIAVFLDSNVLISALIGSAHSAPVVLVDWLAGSPAAALITGRCCIQEVEKHFARRLPQAQPLWQQFVGASGIRIAPCPRKSITGIDAKDAAIVAAAVSASATHFVSGGRAGRHAGWAGKRYLARTGSTGQLHLRHARLHLPIQSPTPMRGSALSARRRRQTKFVVGQYATRA